eukprot:1414646-Pleurochrysis_carterae.AAC.1
MSMQGCYVHEFIKIYNCIMEEAIEDTKPPGSITCQFVRTIALLRLSIREQLLAADAAAAASADAAAAAASAASTGAIRRNSDASRCPTSSNIT